MFLPNLLLNRLNKLTEHMDLLNVEMLVKLLPSKAKAEVVESID